MPEPDPLRAIKTPWGAATPPSGAGAGDVPPIPIPDHTLIRRVGKGSYGEVWLARNALGVYRAVKIIQRSSFDDDRPFEREFAGMQRFEPVSRSHESQLNILQVGRGPDCFYYVMELADDMGRGAAIDEASYSPRNLRSELLLHGRLPVDECIRLGLALTTALENLHRHGLVHRDIKPSNIVFVNGIPKLADIGLVALAESTMSFVGTEGYLPPEGPGTVQADLFSLGKVLYEISTGRDRQQFPELPTGISELPDRAAFAELNEVLLRACAPDVKQRYESAAEMHADLALLQSGKSVSRMRAVERRLKFVARAGAAVTGIAVVAVSAWLWQSRQTRIVRELVQQKETERQAAQENLYFADIRVAYHDWESGQITGMLERLQSHIPQGAEPDLRGWEWYYLLSLCHRDEKTLLGHTGMVRSVSCDPRGQRFASGSEDRSVRIWDAESGNSLAELKGHADSVACVAWSPDGRQIASGGLDGKVILWDAGTFQKLRVLEGEKTVMALAWSPDGQRLAAGGLGHLPAEVDGLVTLWDATSGRRLHHLAGQVTAIWSLAWQPGGNLIVAGEGNPGRMQVWDADQGQLLRTIQVHAGVVSALAWLPDGRRIASASFDQRLRIWDAESWQPLATVDPAHNGFVNALGWSADGQRLVSGGDDGLVKTWHPDTGRLLSVWRGHQGSVRSVAWRNGNGEIFSGSADGTMKVWNVDDPQTARTVPGFSSLAWSPDGRKLAIDTRPKSDAVRTNGEAEGSIQIVDVATLKTALTMPSEAGTLTYPFAWSPDGQRLAVRLPDSDLVRLWDLATQKEWLTLDRGRGGANVWSIAWSPDARRLATGGEDYTVRLWNLETKSNFLTFHGHSNIVGSVVWNPDGRRLASRDWSGRILIWDAASGKGMLELQTPGGGQMGKQYNLSWSPAGDQLAVGGADGSISIWDATTGREIHAFKGHTSPVRSVHWSPDGRRLVSGAEDRTIRIWDAHSGRELLVLPDPVHGRSMVAWCPSGRMISVGQNPAQIFDASIGYELAPQLTSTRTNR